MENEDIFPFIKLRWDFAQEGYQYEYIPCKTVEEAGEGCTIARFFGSEGRVRTYRYQVVATLQLGNALLKYSENPVEWPKDWQIYRGKLRLSGAGKTGDIKSVEWIPEDETRPFEVEFEVISHSCDEIDSVLEAVEFYDQGVSQGVASDALATLEGQKVLRQHFKRERSAFLVRKFKEHLAKNGKIQCSICEFSFPHVYGKELGEGFIEAHHKRPLGDSEEGRETKLDDLIAVCSNCHRMLHRLNPSISVENLKKRMAVAKKVNQRIALIRQDCKRETRTRGNS